MKKLSLLIVAFLAFGCNKENIQPNKTTNQISESMEKGSGFEETVYNELIVHFEPGMTAAEKALKRNEFDVISFETCECADPDLELWIFEPSAPFKEGDPQGWIEDRRETAHVDEDIEGADFSDVYRIDPDIIVPSVPALGIAEGLNLTQNGNAGVTIAILDTGIDYGYEGFTSPFLYQNNGISVGGADPDYFGWNFVNYSNNPYDDFAGRHGTIISNVIYSDLTAQGIPFQILPVKVADYEGKIRTFDAVCGFRYAMNNADVDIINMSFGWSGRQVDILEGFITEAGNNSLIVTSAGNESNDNDLQAHYPSSYSSDNVLSVASMTVPTYDPNGGSSSMSIQLTHFSNYGVNSVDVAAQGIGVGFPFLGNNFVVQGTSYSAAFATAYASELFEEENSSITLKQKVIQTSIFSNDLNQISSSSYLPY